MTIAQPAASSNGERSSGSGRTPIHLTKWRDAISAAISDPIGGVASRDGSDGGASASSSPLIPIVAPISAASPLARLYGRTSTPYARALSEAGAVCSAHSSPAKRRKHVAARARSGRSWSSLLTRNDWARM